MRSSLLLLCLFILSCQSHPTASASKRDVASEKEAVPAESWAQKYLEAQKTCKAFSQFKKEKAPNEELAVIAETKYKIKCHRNEDLLKNLKYDWLKKDVVINGLRNTKNPEVFSKYYQEFLDFSSIDRNKIEFLERTKLYQKILPTAKEEKTRNNLLWMFPVFYPTYKMAIPREKLFEAGFEYRMQRKFAEARKVYLDIIAENKLALKKAKTVTAAAQALSNISRASDFVRSTHRIEEKKQKGIVAYKKDYLFFQNYFLKNPKKEYAKFYTNAVVQLARDMWTEGQLADAKKLLQATVEKAKGKASLDQVYWVLGRMEQEDKKYAAAVGLFEKALAEKPEKDFELKLRWLVAWNYKKSGQLKEALKSFEEFGNKADEYQDQISYFKSLFWQAKTLQSLKRKDDAKTYLKKVAKENPLGYYGRLSMLEVDPDAIGEKAKPKDLPKTNDLVSEDSHMTIRTLLEMTEYDLVAEYLSSLWRGLEKSDRKKIETKEAFFAWSDAAQLYKENLQFIEILNDDDKKEILEKYPQLFFPEPYLDLVKNYSEKLNVPREFVYSLMRQESLFDKNARSQADAFGLLQLLPQNAKKYTKKVGIDFKQPEELFKPEVIIPLGVAHLAHLRQIFKGSMLLTAASYNAGVDPVKGWIKTRFNGDPYEFIEDIPYLETEYYTKLIFRNLSYYVQFHPELSSSEKTDLLKEYFELSL